ncbi:MAG: DM13 domain-containing protein [Komarekiella atlantica HA4396-MV6]|jgi:hypothetical protein|nr:DM13 domain-containing protein [Komarekiella atlantica HA4396-MV6]
MRFQHLAIIGIVAVINISCTSKETSNLPSIQAQSTTTLASTVVETGTFKAGEHPTTGKVSIVTERGKRYLEFDQSFKTNKGPDLFVILHRSDAPPVYGIKEKDYASISRLQKTSGSQRYALPENVKLTDFRSVAVWCRQFNANFGYASLPK